MKSKLVLSFMTITALPAVAQPVESPSQVAPAPEAAVTQLELAVDIAATGELDHDAIRAALAAELGVSIVDRDAFRLSEKHTGREIWRADEPGYALHGRLSPLNRAYLPCCPGLSMQAYQREFIRFAIERGVLRFGEFTLKSGRTSPYFFNAGLFDSGLALAQLGRFYAAAVVDSGIDFDVLFGPAYKGIPLAATTAVALAEHHQRDMPWCFNRKEAKDHGEGGTLVGAPLAGRVLIVDDVITAGTAIREVMQIIQAQGTQAAGVLIALNRQERGQGELSAIQEVERDFGMPVVSIVSLEQVLEYLAGDAELKQYLPAVQAYRAEYGI